MLPENFGYERVKNGYPCLAPALLPASFCSRSGILHGDADISLVSIAEALPCLFADLKELVLDFFNTPMTLCGHLAPEIVGMAPARARTFLIRRRTGKGKLVIRPVAFAIV